ncbi:neutral/alkaline ceramidase [Proteobacteria bacterium 005FR1]|nr:neutral/alkaline ceramidase [Proteobacteria bacterium 005FR1]
MYRHLISGLLLVLCSLSSLANSSSYQYLIGTGKADVTGPALGMPMWGFARQGQNTEGIHYRLHSRAYVIADPDEDARIAFVSVDVGSITNAVQLSVIDALQEEFGETYRLDNVLLSATHTHAGPSGYWHYGAKSPLGSPFYPAHFNMIVAGIVQSIREAHGDLAPGNILFNRGKLTGAGANRSATAYDANPEEERRRYDSNMDQDMTLLKLVREDGEVGLINWFAVHPTAMTYDNHLISGDHKGHASNLFEKEEGGDFVAAFAQSNCGDITPNLNLNNTGPGENEFETTRIIAERQYNKARELFDNASEKLSGPVRSRQRYFTFEDKTVAPQFTGGSAQQTCPSAYGYTFAAGSTEDGGGNPLFREGMTKSDPQLDKMLAERFKLPPPKPETRKCHAEKAILIAPGELEPIPGQTQIVPISIATIGQLAIIGIPAEVTTMAGRRLRETVRKVLGDDYHYVIAGYVNDYTGYVTTREEYATQQYEGGHTLYGPWTLGAYQQEFATLASAMRDNKALEPGPTPVDLRTMVEGSEIPLLPEKLPQGKQYGEPVERLSRSYRRGEQVVARFWSSNPSASFEKGEPYVRVERREGDSWQLVDTDDHWATRSRWYRPDSAPEALQYQVDWTIPEGVPSGSYRIVHQGYADGTPFEGSSNTFKVR